MKCVILQPSYVPWRGFFHQIQKADVFVFYDDVEYDRRGWRNRNRIKGGNGPFWLTIPVESKGLRARRATVDEVRIDWSRPWNERHLRSRRLAYGRARHFSDYEAMLERWFAQRDELLADFTIRSTIELAGALGIANVRFLRASSLGIGGRKSERLLRILEAVGADHYITGPAARDYLDESLLGAAGIAVEYMAYDYPEYPQPHPPFEARLSVLDLLFHTGPEAGRFIWGEGEGVGVGRPSSR